MYWDKEPADLPFSVATMLGTAIEFLVEEETEGGELSFTKKHLDPEPVELPTPEAAVEYLCYKVDVTPEQLAQLKQALVLYVNPDMRYATVAVFRPQAVERVKRGEPVGIS